MVKARRSREAKIRVGDTKNIGECVPSIENLLHNPVFSIRADELEELSEEAQREEGVYG